MCEICLDSQPKNYAELRHHLPLLRKNAYYKTNAENG